MEFALFSPTENHILEMLVLFTTLLTLFVTVGYALIKKMKFDVGLAYAFAVIYVGFIIAATTIVIK